MHRYITCISVISIIFVIAYSPAMQGGFIWDDGPYLINNITLQSWHGLLDIWFIPKNNPHYYPMLFSGFWLEYHMWGLEPLGYHINNILLHMAGTFVLWRVLRLLCIPGAGMVAAFFYCTRSMLSLLHGLLSGKMSFLVFLSFFSVHVPTPLRFQGRRPNIMRWYIAD